MNAALDRITFRAMGSTVNVIAERSDDVASNWLRAAPRWFSIWESRLSRFAEDSDLCRVNRAGGVPTSVCTTFERALAAAITAARWTDGLVTPTMLDQIELAGYDKSFEFVSPTFQTRSCDVPAATAGDYRSIVIDGAACAVTLPPGMRIDLGGTAKGWSADRAAKRLSSRGAALVDAGGDIAVSGPRSNGEAWPIAIAHPFDPRREITVLFVDKGGVASSGRDYRFWQREGESRHHILDPRTGRPAITDVVSATVIGASAWEAEVAAKVVLILGGAGGLRWLNAQGLAGLAILEGGDVIYTQTLSSYLWS